MKKEELTDRVNDVYLELFHNIVCNLTTERSYDGPEHKEGSYPFIPMDPHRVIQEFVLLREQLKSIKNWSGHKVKKSKFLDAGCGVGNVMLIAKAANLCKQVHGIEYFDETYERARLLLGLVDHEKFNTFIHKDDILKFENYNRFDVIYYYCPFSDHRLEAMFEERVEDSMKIGAILLPHLKRSTAIQDDSRFERLKIPNNRFAFIKVRRGKRKATILNIRGMEFRKNPPAFLQEREATMAEKYSLSLM